MGWLCKQNVGNPDRVRSRCERKGGNWNGEGGEGVFCDARWRGVTEPRISTGCQGWKAVGKQYARG
jgi:hypothetical protein